MTEVRSLTGAVLDSTSREWMLECEAVMVLRMAASERNQFLDGIRRKRGEAGHRQLRMRCHELEPYYVHSLPRPSDRVEYLARVESRFGAQARRALQEKMLAIAAERGQGGRNSAASAAQA